MTWRDISFPFRSFQPFYLALDMKADRDPRICRADEGMEGFMQGVEPFHRLPSAAENPKRPGAKAQEPLDARGAAGKAPTAAQCCRLAHRSKILT